MYATWNKWFYYIYVFLVSCKKNESRISPNRKSNITNSNVANSKLPGFFYYYLMILYTGVIINLDIFTISCRFWHCSSGFASTVFRAVKHSYFPHMVLFLIKNLSFKNTVLSTYMAAAKAQFIFYILGARLIWKPLVLHDLFLKPPNTI